MPEEQGQPEEQDAPPPQGRITLRSFARTFRRPVKWVLAYWAFGVLILLVAVVLAPMMVSGSYVPCFVGFARVAAIAVGLEFWLRKRRAASARGVPIVRV